METTSPPQLAVSEKEGGGAGPDDVADRHMVELPQVFEDFESALHGRVAELLYRACGLIPWRTVKWGSMLDSRA